jgi:predicted DNA-binding antitoxin AbrB/MazE fold protein
MAQTIQAIFRDGMIEPLEELDLPDAQRLRVTVEIVENEEERQARELHDKAADILRHRGTRRYTRDEIENLFGPIYPIDRELARRGFEKLGGKLSEDIIRDRGEY